MSAVRWDWPKQVHLTENGEIGDCWRCCVAAVLQVPAETVPHFVRDGRSADADTQRWLNQRGFVLIEVGKVGFSLHGWGRDDVIRLPVIECGPTVRSKKRGAHHAVVAISGELVYDPHPSGAGLLCATEQWLIIPAHAPAVIPAAVVTGKECDTKRGACQCGAFHIGAEGDDE